MEVNSGRSYSNGKQNLKHPRSANEGKKNAEKDTMTPVFVNHAAIAWHESRKKWVGDKSQRSPRMAKDSIISWSTAYEDLLSSNEPFAEPISLPEMVDFLVDIWYDEGLFD
ncbi:Zinc finger protein [Quillaja saponaria]|uniref:Zinc finger protein n=1 Tax=Quillaja saponaria TaxID=32244 RepID=A0AAD7M5V0_QUISA|nr:Zinc finger protein [Quillaja saponaria]